MIKERKILIMMPGIWDLSYWKDKVAIKVIQNVKYTERNQFCFGGLNMRYLINNKVKLSRR